MTAMSAAAAIGPGGWDHVGVGATSSTPSLDGHVWALNTQDRGSLYVGGDFTRAGGNSKAARVARWDGSAWSALGNTPLSNGSVFAIAYHAGRVFVGGTFLNAGGHDNADFLAVWNGTSWEPFCTSTNPGPSFGGSVAALEIIGNTLYVGGSFQNGAGIDAADYLLACDLTTGASRSTVPADGDFTGGVYALAADSNGTLYAGGQFINVAHLAGADHVASYDGSGWHAMGDPTTPAINDYVRSLTVAGTNVYVGTDAVDVAGIPTADHVARWNGSAWSAVGSNHTGTAGWFPASAFIYALTTYGSLVVAAGSFQNADGVATADSIAYFDGFNWRPIGSDGAGNGPLPGPGSALAMFGGKLYAAGNFTTAGGDNRSRSLAAYAIRQPDASIGGHAAGPFTGNGVYSSTGAGESRTATIARGNSGTFYAKIQNDGLTPASFTITGAGGATGIVTSYHRGARNITTSVRAGTYNTGLIPARGAVLLRMVVTVANSSANSAMFVVSARSQTGTSPDGVRAIVHAA